MGHRRNTPERSCRNVVLCLPVSQARINKSHKEPHTLYTIAYKSTLHAMGHRCNTHGSEIQPEPPSHRPVASFSSHIRELCTVRNRLPETCVRGRDRCDRKQLGSIWHAFTHASSRMGACTAGALTQRSPLPTEVSTEVTSLHPEHPSTEVSTEETSPSDALGPAPRWCMPSGRRVSPHPCL